jgi:hypothetical protein
MPGRVTITIDGTSFVAFQAEFSMGTQKDAAGMPVLQSFACATHVRVDLNDDKNLPFDTISKLFKLANIPDRTKIKEMKIEFWKDDANQDVVCAYKFKGWISMFRVSNVAGTAAGYNHVLDLELTPIINKENYQEVSIGN